MRIALCYRWRHGRWPDLEGAPRFTEMVQRRKLFDRDPRQSVLMDKLAAKAEVAAALGPEWTVPTAWSGHFLPDDPPFGFPAIVKARHGCNQYRVLREPPSDRAWADLQKLGAHWMSKAYGHWLDEWAYRDTPRGLLAEPLLPSESALPVDYKIYVFGGQATHVQVHLDRAADHRWVVHDRDWTQLVAAGDTPPPPRSLLAMLDAAEALATGQDFLRVDFYEVAGRPLFGEFCLYPGSGLDPFATDWIDFELGALWHAAERRPLCAAQDSIDFSPVPAHLAAIEAR
ncbi:ATP-grasp fold amidoligase family protein [Tsuneonella amylolytica]|uniref:ATP-grasp fold amidoligase family protein n=1 Tax=Tsuneonella amylolytica TaxID=2338327 RepID=UPI001F31976F|nr:ATP-grasp fold amidoligase family protein [Tsuneonella amylolytica]